MLINQKRFIRLDGFIYLSCCLHLVLFAVQAILPDHEAKPPTLNPIKIKFVEPKPAQVARQKPATIVDAPIPRKQEKPETSELLSRANSRAHGNLEKKKAEKVRNNKTVVPEAMGTFAKLSRPRPAPRKLKPVVKKTPPRVKKKKYIPPSAIVERGVIEPEPEPILEPEDSLVPSATAAQPTIAKKTGPITLYDGFDPEKYAKLDTHTPPERATDDDQPISLDTKETKYVSYFTRIKQQIERVWIYPLEAARRGISGQLTLRFQISRDGNLLLVGVTDESGYEILDFSAIKAVKGAAPFYPIPSTIERDKLTIVATFIYSPTYGAP